MNEQEARTAIPYDTIDPRVHGIVRAINAMGATTTGSCYGMQDEQGNPTEDWYIKITFPRNADGWMILDRLTRTLPDVEIMLFAWPAPDGVSFQLYGYGEDIAAVERALASAAEKSTAGDKEG